MKAIRRHTWEAALVCEQKYVSDLRPGIRVSDKVGGLKWFEEGERLPVCVSVCVSACVCVCLCWGWGQVTGACVYICLLSALSQQR